MITDLVKPINDNKFVLALVMMFLNISSKYIDFGFSKTQEHALRNGIGKELLIFCVMSCLIVSSII